MIAPKRLQRKGLLKMKKLIIQLENCYGIKKLEHRFDFSVKDKVHAIYAPNGSMKSSLAQTFKDLSEGKKSKDRIYPTRENKRTITDEKGNELPEGTVVVIPPYDEVFGNDEKTSTLLVNDKMKKEYEQLHIEIDRSKDAFLKAMKKQSGSKKNLEAEISLAFTKSDTKFFQALFRIKEELLKQKDAPFEFVHYDTIFDDKVLGFLGTKDFKAAIEEYVKRYNELIGGSTFFKKGVFEYYNGAAIAKNLADNGFFEAKHTVSLNAAEKMEEISSQKQLEELINKEQESITKDKDLQKKFAEIEVLLNKNQTLKALRAYLTQHETLLPHLANIDDFKEEIWKSYFKAQIELYTDLITKYQDTEARRKQIEEEASRERTQWEEAIEIFNERFFVPFTLTANNKTAVILGEEGVLSLAFTFDDGNDSVSVERTTLLEALSQGEKKALYVLHIIFEIEARRKAQLETLFVIDDLADSFDYKNKYAIVQYLKEIAEEPLFRQIILTHNFDFFRTIHYKLVPYSQCLTVNKSDTDVTLEKAEHIRNPFVNAWKPKFFEDARKRIASIPFMRNIIEYTKGESDPDYLTLTSLLHWKADSAGVLQRDLDRIFKTLFGEEKEWADGDTPVLDMIRAEAKACLTNGGGYKFENKIVLSIAIRIDADRFMVTKIVESGGTVEVGLNQSSALLDTFEASHTTESDAIQILQRVLLMTPENIHLNSFMYEPILDMADDHLKKLYKEVLALNGEGE